MCQTLVTQRWNQHSSCTHWNSQTNNSCRFDQNGYLWDRQWSALCWIRRLRPTKENLEACLKTESWFCSQRGDIENFDQRNDLIQLVFEENLTCSKSTRGGMEDLRQVLLLSLSCVVPGARARELALRHMQGHSAWLRAYFLGIRVLTLDPTSVF